MTRALYITGILTAPPNTDGDLVPRRIGYLNPAPAPRWGCDAKPEVSR